MRILYHLPLSPQSRLARLSLSERRIPFEMRVENVWESGEDFLALNPAREVPVLVEESGLAIPGGSVIAEYLEEAYTGSTLLGHRLEERIETRRLLNWFDVKFSNEVSRNLLGERSISGFQAVARLMARQSALDMPICAFISTILDGFQKRAPGWAAQSSLMRIWRLPRICPVSILSGILTGHARPSPKTGTHASNPARASALFCMINCLASPRRLITWTLISEALTLAT